MANKSFYEEELNRERQKVTNEENLNLSNKNLKKYTLVALGALVLGLNIYGVSKYVNKPTEPSFESDYAYSFDINETDWCEPIENVRYLAPNGYTLEYIDGVPKAVKTTISYANVTTITNSEGVITYSAPTGYSIENRDGQLVAVKQEKEIVDVVTVTEYSAPEGYMLIGDKCFKINETENKTKGR